MKDRLLSLLFFVLQLLVAVGVARLIAWAAFFDRKSVSLSEAEAFGFLALALAFILVSRK